jgi:hypothetical protein
VKALPIQFDESIPAWEKAIYAFLAEKERRSGSMRTVAMPTAASCSASSGRPARRQNRSRRQTSSASRTASGPRVVSPPRLPSAPGWRASARSTGS